MTSDQLCIKILQEEVAELKSDMRKAQNEVTDLVVYLTSVKFRDDTTVQVRDILHRIETLRLLLIQDVD